MAVSVRRALGRELEECLRLRERVFVREQGVPLDLERDSADDRAVHLAAVTEDGAVVGTCRLLGDDDGWHLGRMAVDADWRGRGVGALVLREAQLEARAAGADELVLAAQLPARGFYAREGYVEEGPEFEEAGIPHVLMRRSLLSGPPATPAPGRAAPTPLE